ncbi:MAG: cyclic nucleotide-binding domain-containing protein [Pseudomonadota bacterium]
MDEELSARLKLLVPLNNLSEIHQEQVIVAADLLDFKKNELIFRQGDRDNFSFYVLEGKVELYADDQLIKKVEGGEAASFQALAQLQPRQMSAQTRSKTKVLRVDRTLVDQLLSVGDEPSTSSKEIEVDELEDDASSDWLTQMLQSALFANVPPSNIQKLLDILETIEAKAGDIVISQGDAGDYYYAIQTGSCEVLRKASSQKLIRIAELGPGARFGEESLVSNAKRNATVKMVTDGELARLKKEDFIELIKKPVLHTCSLQEARELVDNGARWVDVRFAEEHESNGLEDSINIPLSFLRSKVKELDPELHYIAYCDTGGRSSAAAFLMTQAGYAASYVENGAISEVPLGQESAPEPDVEEKEEKKASEEILEANVRAETLNADLTKANLQIERAQQLMAEAEAAKREADRIVQEKLREEREKLAAQVAQIEAEKLAAKQQAENTLRLAKEQLLVEAEKAEKEKAEAATRLEKQLREEREKLAEETALVEAKLSEAKNLKSQLEEQQQAAEQEVQKRIQDQQERTKKLQLDSEQRLREKEQELETLYLKQADELEKLQLLREDSEKELALARKEIQTEQSQSAERLEAIESKEAELAEKHTAQLADLRAEEERMRDKLQEEIDRERQILEQEFTKSNRAIEKAEADQRAAAQARAAAAEEAKRMIQEYKAQHDQKFAEQERRLAEKRSALEQEAEQLKNEFAKAAAAREEAEALKAKTEAQLAAASEKQVETDQEEERLRQEIANIEQRAIEASAQLQKAIAVETEAEDRQRAHEESLEKTYNTRSEMNILLQSELDDWVAEQERLQESTAQKYAAAKQQKIIERIKAQAVKSRQQEVQHDRALLDEIASQLDN